MSLVPVYGAAVNVQHYSNIIGWNVPITYTRPTYAVGALAGHVGDPYTVTENMRPIMSPSPFEYEAISHYPNNGAVDGGPYNHQVIVDPPAFGLTGYWNLSQLMQVQMAEWADHSSYIAPLISAIESRSIEDAWLTTKRHITLLSYEEDVALFSFADDNNKNLDSYGVMGSMVNTPLGKPAPEVSATPCLITLQWKGFRYFYHIIETIENLIAFADDPPEILPVTKESAPAGSSLRMQYQRFQAFDAVPNYTWGTVDTVWDLPEPRLLDNAGIPEYLYHAQPFMFEWVTDAERLAVLSASDPDIISVDNLGPGVDQVGGLSVASITLGGGLWGYVPYLYATKLLQFNRESGGYGQGYYFTERPKAWKHDDPEFIGYVPYTYYLSTALIKDYAANPDDRFDGMFFYHKIKVASVTRNWHAYVRNLRISQDPEPVVLKSGALQAYAWRDTVTNEIINEPPNCSLMTPISVGFSSDLLGPITYPGFDWDNYEWPTPVITLPAGTFLFEDGNAAPIYPDFKGAYVYDMHLKKWGKFDGDYKRLLDYSAINTYMPNQQSFTRFGIFGGVLTADGKIRLFDDAPAVASITYGKIGYYRQGMTSLEEIRIHHRDFKAGAVRINSSIEGKLIEPSFTTTTNFVASSMWQVNGGYSAKWHTITVLGSFDLAYMEFRGIPAGRR